MSKEEELVKNFRGYIQGLTAEMVLDFDLKGHIELHPLGICCLMKKDFSGSFHLKHMLEYEMNEYERLLYRNCKTEDDYKERARILFPLFMKIDNEEMTKNEYLDDDNCRFFDLFIKIKLNKPVFKFNTSKYVEHALDDIYYTFESQLQ